MNYTGKKVLVTGGLGFIGSNVAKRLVESGANVAVIDGYIDGCGANYYNLAPVRQAIDLVVCNISDRTQVQRLVAGADVIFNLAGEVSHVHSMHFPERDLAINTLAQLQFLQTVVRIAPGIRIIYAGTRQVYGAAAHLPVDESQPINPVDFNGVHKYTSTLYHQMLTRIGQLDAAVLRLTNVYGPRMALNIPCQGFIGTFLRKALRSEPIDVYGDGSQLRDLLYVDDCVEAFLQAGAIAVLPSSTYNVGGPEALSVLEVGQICSDAAGHVPLRVVPFPEQARQIDIGSYCSDCRLIEQELGWRPKTAFRDGIASTFEYYRAQLPHYLKLDSADTDCNLPEHMGSPRRLTLV